MQINKTINYNAGDLQRAYSAHLFANHPIRSRLLPFLGAFCLVMGLILKFLIRKEESPTELSTFCIVYGTALLIYFVFKRRTLGKRMFKKLNDYHQPIQFSFNNDGLKIDSPTMNANIQWASFVKALIKENVVMLYPNEISFYFFDKNHFTESEFLGIKEMVRKNITKVK